MINAVQRYLRLETQATGDETKAEDYRRRADDDRWEQCRIVYEAITSGEYSGRSFAKAVDKSEAHINRQRRIWDKWSASGPTHRPNYSDAYQEILNRPTGPDATHERSFRGARNLPAKDKAKLVRELLDDPEISAAVEPEIIKHAAATPSRTARTIERASENRPAPVKSAAEPTALEYLAALGVGANAVVGARRQAHDVSTIVAALRNEIVRSDDEAAIREDVTDLRKAADIHRMYADEIEIAMQGGISDRRLEALLDGEI